MKRLGRGARAARSTGAAGELQVRDRIRDLRRVPARELIPNPKNWRRHPPAQIKALRAQLSQIGYADVILVRELPDGSLMIIDGHLRAETTPDLIVPVVVLDVTETEADQLLLTLDPMAAMAETDTERLKALIETVRTDNERAAGADPADRRQPCMGGTLSSAADRAGGGSARACRRALRQVAHAMRAGLAGWAP
jgi:ParB-like nuclease domain